MTRVCEIVKLRELKYMRYQHDQFHKTTKIRIIKVKPKIFRTNKQTFKLRKMRKNTN